MLKQLLHLNENYCARCGSSEKLDRFEQSYTSTGFIILCEHCNTRIHNRDGSLKRGIRKPKDCAVCGHAFVPSHYQKTCCRTCLRVLNRFNAMKYWSKKRF